MKKSKLIEGKITLAPTDLSNFLRCRHSVFLELQAANGKAARPVRRDALLEELRERGHKHERAYLKRLQSEGLTIAGLDGAEDGEDPAASSQEITLARETRSRTMLQLCVYSYLLGQLQDFPPEYMHVATPGSNFRPSSYRVDEYAAYFGLVKQDLHEFSFQPDKTYPEKVSRCDYCSWWADCEAAARLRDWIEQVRNKTMAEGHALPRPELKTGEASGNISALDREIVYLRNGLLKNIPGNEDERSGEQQARFVLAHMMEFHRREDKASLWEFYRLLELDASELAGERRALTELCHEDTIEPGAAPVESYTFPPQELDARKKDDVYALDGSRVGTVVAISHSGRTIDIKKRMDRADFSLYSGILHNQIPSKVQRQSLMRFASPSLPPFLK